MRRPIAGVVILALLAPITAEYLLGDQYLFDPPPLVQLGQLVVYVPFYGFGAVGIREIVRRRGGGWPAILVLALAFGLVEEGLLGQSLFNPDYLGLHLSDQARVPVLGVSALWSVYVLVLHVVWSIGAPIAVTERLVGTGPWLGRAGRWTTGVLYVLGALATAGIGLMVGHGFVASPARLAGTALVAAGLVVVAVRRTGRTAAIGGRPLLGVAIGLVASSGFQLSRHLGIDPWGLTAILLGFVVVTAVLVHRYRPGAFGLAVGAVVTYWWVGMTTAVQGGTAAVVEQSLLIAASAVLMVVAAASPTPADADRSRSCPEPTRPRQPSD